MKNHEKLSANGKAKNQEQKEGELKPNRTSPVRQIKGRLTNNPLTQKEKRTMSKQIQDAFELLGKKVQDRVTNTKGVVTSISFDLYGCVQVIVNPGIDKTGTARDSNWFDVSRLKVTSDKPVMEVPTFGLVKGPASKPNFMKP